MTDQSPTPLREIDPDVPRNRSPIIFMAIVGITAISIAVVVLGRDDRRSIKATITVPQLNVAETRGREIFNGTCATCHGIDAIGDTDIGPPLMHPYYRMEIFPSDMVRRAIMLGKAQDKWKYGHMPAQIKLNENEITDVMKYFDALRENNSLGN
ncbi:MAG: cytochrome c [Rhodospirillaceae bacterium]|nr:cytochrome c [Rhodospirillaceae bacterium]